MQQQKKHNFKAEALSAANMLGLNMSRELFGINDLAKGLQVEYEHGTNEPETNVTNDDLLMTAKIALAHLREYPDYYERLEIVEGQQTISTAGIIPDTAILPVLIIASVIILIVHYFQDHAGRSIIGDYTYHQVFAALIFFWAIAGLLILHKQY